VEVEAALQEVPTVEEAALQEVPTVEEEAAAGERAPCPSPSYQAAVEVPGPSPSLRYQVAAVGQDRFHSQQSQVCLGRVRGFARCHFHRYWVGDTIPCPSQVLPDQEVGQET
jgi:hypothetical protein